MTAGPKLIITADDFGLTTGVNQAIARACCDGIVTTASLMVNGAAFESAVDIARRTPALDLGLHINLTEGRPTSPASDVASLAGPDGFRYTHPAKLCVAIVQGNVAAAELELEIRSQLERALAAGIEISHFDGHKHVHVLPEVLRTLVRIGPEYGIAAIRSTFERVPRLSSLLVRSKSFRLKLAQQFAFGKVLTAAWIASRGRIHSLASPRRFYGITQTGFLDIQALADVVRDLGEGVHELMTHPGYDDVDLRKTPTRLRAQRERELELLTGVDARRLLTDSGVNLVSYKDCFSVGRPIPACT